MGEGLYNVLGYGVLDYEQPAGDSEQFYEELMDLGVSFSYETKEPYAVIRLAVDNEFLQGWWKLKPLPDEALRCAARRARYADDVPFKVPKSAQTRWSEAQRLALNHGVQLPDARLIVLNDWD